MENDRQMTKIDTLQILLFWIHRLNQSYSVNIPKMNDHQKYKIPLKMRT